jgi:hypothetical protein
MYVPAVGARRNRFNALDVISTDNIWAVGSWGDVLGQFRFLIQHWDGNSWTHIPSPITNQSGELSEILAISPNDIWTIGGYTTGGAVYMHWNGSNWSIVPSPGSTGDIVAISTNNIYSVGSNVAKWDGSSWTIVDNLSQLYGPALGSATLLSNGDIWAGGRYLNNEDELVTLTVKIQDEGITGINNNGTIPFNYTLFQNFPNPFNPSTTIKFYNPANNRVVQVNVYNSLGQFVETLVNSDVSSGVHTVNWNAENAASGVYFYKLIIDGNIIDTKKMLLIK